MNYFMSLYRGVPGDLSRPDVPCGSTRYDEAVEELCGHLQAAFQSTKRAPLKPTMGHLINLDGLVVAGARMTENGPIRIHDSHPDLAGRPV